MKRILLLGIVIGITSTANTNAQVQTRTSNLGLGSISGGQSTDIGFSFNTWNPGWVIGVPTGGIGGVATPITVLVTNLTTTVVTADADDITITLHHDANPGGAGNPTLDLASSAIANAGTNQNFTLSELLFQDTSAEFAGTQATPYLDGQIAFRPQGAGGGGVGFDPFLDTFGGITPATNWFVRVTNNGTGVIDFDSITLTVSAVPEPATMALFGLGLFGLGCGRRKRKPYRDESPETI